MKKLFFVCAAAALLASCSQNEGVSLLVQDNNDGAITFEAFARTAVTKGTVETSENFMDKGIGVFAFYQPANGGTAADFTTTKYPSPDFMYNQKVSIASGDTKWTYSPIKYWPNNKGDKLSFFAYAPYDVKTSWEDLGIKTNTIGTSVSKTFEIANEVVNQKDYLFAEPTLNKAKPSVITHDASGNASAADASGDADVVKFNFKHVLSKINIFVGVKADIQTASGSAPSSSSDATAWTDANTDITIQSIEFKDLAQKFIYTITTTDGSSWSAANWKTDGKQNIIVEPCAAAKTIDDTWAAGWHRYLAGTTDFGTTDEEYMFVAPETVKDKEFVFTYTVKTEDTSNDKNTFEKTYTITKKWSEFGNTSLTALEAGKQYNLYFLIGMQGVKIAATITDWETPATDHQIYVPSPNGD